MAHRQPPEPLVAALSPGVVSQASPRPRYVHLARLLVLWHLLSLDAPTIAVLWTLLPARLTQVPLPIATPLAMALAVWTLYAADRLLDTSHLTPPLTPDQIHDLEPRHLFHHRHRSAFLIAIAFATFLLAILLPRLARASIDIYLIEAALMAGYFLLIHATPIRQPRSVPKEFLVGLFFAAATFIPTISRVPALRLALLPCAILFAALCTLNCLYIYAWEHPDLNHPHPATRAAIHLLRPATVALLVFALALSVRRTAVPHLPFYPVACAISAVALLLLHQARRNLSRLTLRAAADAVLLTPILFLPFL